MSSSRYRNARAEGHIVRWYRIGEVLSQGGLGITCLAEDTRIQQRVTITWSNGFVDTLTLAANSKRMNDQNNLGLPISVSR